MLARAENPDNNYWSHFWCESPLPFIHVFFIQLKDLKEQDPEAQKCWTVSISVRMQIDQGVATNLWIAS